MPTIAETRKFLEENNSFFLGPINNQESFVNFYIENGLQDEITDYSNKLCALLYKNSTTTKVDAKTKVARRVINPWRKGNFVPALEHEEVRQFLINNKDDPALIIWRNPDAISLGKLLNNLKEKQLQLADRNQPKASKAAKELHNSLATTINNFVNNKINSNEFSNQCLNAIKIAKAGELSNNRDIEPIIKGILNFLILFSTLSISYWVTGKFDIIKPSTTKSMALVSEIEAPLKNISSNSMVNGASLKKALSQLGLFKTIDDNPIDRMDIEEYKKP